MSTNDPKIRESFLDAAATHAVGASTAEESRQFAHDLAAASPQEKRQAREFHEAAARLAAASPYMSPPEDLRGKILAATAPASFKMEDYRKTMRDDSRVWRWAVIAATLFLVAAAYWNVNLQSAVKTQNAQLIQQNTKMLQMRQAILDQNKALAMMVDRKTEKAELHSNGKTVGAVLMDGEEGTAVVLVPRSLLREGKMPIFELTQANGEKKAFKTIPVAVDFPSDPITGVDMSKDLQATMFKFEGKSEVRAAGFH